MWAWVSVGFDDGGSWVLTTMEIGVGFDEIGMGVDNGGDRRGGDWWVARLAWRRSVGGEIGGVVVVVAL